MNPNSQDTQPAQSPAQPTLCAAGCGFFANPACSSLCSKCYRDSQQKEQASMVAATKLGAAPAPGFTAPEEPRQAHAIPEQPRQPSLEQVQQPASSCASQAASVEEAVPSVAVLEPEQEDARPVQKNTSRCFCCNKKVGLTGFKCRGCDYTFCGGHRIPEAHHCAGLEQFKEQGRAQLQKANPVIQAAKINKV